METRNENTSTLTCGAETRVLVRWPVPLGYIFIAEATVAGMDIAAGANYRLSRVAGLGDNRTGATVVRGSLPVAVVAGGLGTSWVVRVRTDTNALELVVTGSAGLVVRWCGALTGRVLRLV